jgi:hypothetical protein
MVLLVRWQVAPCGRSRLGCKYRFYTEFQSHEGEFDYLKSLEIEEKINQIKWCRKTNGAQFLISANGEPRDNGLIGMSRVLGLETTGGRRLRLVQRTPRRPRV